MTRDSPFSSTGSLVESGLRRPSFELKGPFKSTSIQDIID